MAYFGIQNNGWSKTSMMWLDSIETPTQVPACTRPATKNTLKIANAVLAEE
jgi:hypothetical protein